MPLSDQNNSGTPGVAGPVIVRKPWESVYEDWFLHQGRPLAKQFLTAIDPSTGLLQQPYQLSTQADTRALQGLRDEALRTGPSRWRSLEEAAQRDRLAQTSAGQVAAARNQLAMSGGLRSGAAERLASQGMRANLTGGQDISRNLAIADEQKRMQTLQALPGQELQQAGFERDTSKYNIDKALGEILQKRAVDASQYNEQMRAWAAQNTANAAPSGGGGKK